MPSSTGPSKTLRRRRARHALARALDQRRVVGDEHERRAGGDLLGDARLALALEGLVADREHLVDQQHVGVEVRGDREAEAQEHARGVRRDRRVDEVAELGERDDRLQALLDLLLDCSPCSAPLRKMFSRPEKSRPKPAPSSSWATIWPPQRDAAGVQRHDPRQHAQRRGLAGAVAADHADGLARLDAQRDVAQRLHRRRAAGALAADQHLLQRAAAVGLDAERARGVLEDDLARSQPSSRRTALTDHRQLALHAIEQRLARRAASATAATTT